MQNLGQSMSVKYKASELLVRQARREDMAAVAEMIQVGYVCVHLSLSNN